LEIKSNLPAKSAEEALKHKQEYEKMIEQAKKKGKLVTPLISKLTKADLIRLAEQKDQESKAKKQEQQLKKEDFMANSLKIWHTEIIPNWTELRQTSRTQLLWWHGYDGHLCGLLFLL
jgi:hypothetical protein